MAEKRVSRSGARGRGAVAPLAALFAAALTVPSAGAVPGVLHAGARTSPGSETGPQTLLGRASLLWASAPWQQLKVLWRKLDRIDPGPQGYGSFHGSPVDSINLWRLEMEQVLEDLRAEAGAPGMDSLEMEAIADLVRRRFDLLCWGTMVPMTRMMPPPVYGQIDSILVRIEQRIDALGELRGRSTLDSREMREGFASLASTVESYFLLDAVSRNTGYHGDLYGAIWPLEADRLLASVDSARTAALERIALAGEAYEGEETETAGSFDRLLSDLEAMRGRLPALIELIRDLEFLDPRPISPSTPED